MVSEVVRAFIAREFFKSESIDALRVDQPLVSSGLLDSVATLKLVMFLEEKFSITIDSADIADGHLDTLQSIELLVNRKQHPG